MQNFGFFGILNGKDPAVVYKIQGNKVCAAIDAVWQ
jgi:hypothetical protein